jgi:hypothetical protein
MQVKNWLDEKDYKVLDWPPNSPDLSIIEHVWGPLKYQMRKNAKSDKKQDLLEALGSSWSTCVTPEHVEKLYCSMPARIHA